jgi:uncharacterized protein (DUF1800 family)
MYNQNRTFRQYGLGRFDELVLKTAQDPAMLIWLDTVQNRRGALNENYSRELQELFTMGIFDVVTGQPNYTEDDIKEIARAFTGWQFFLSDRQDPFSYQFRVNQGQHDNGQKTIYAGTPWATTAALDGTDVISIIAARPSTPRFLVKKLFDFFVRPLNLNDPSDRGVIDQLAQVYFSRDHSLKALIRAVLTSPEFFGKRARRALVKQPIEFLVGPIRMLGASYNVGDLSTNRRDSTLFGRSAQLGQDLFNPPDVAGWDDNLAWINTAWMLQRYNAANALATARPAAEAPGAFITIEQLRRNVRPVAKKTVKLFLAALNVEVPKPMLRSLINYLETDDNGTFVAWNPTDTNIDKKVRGLVHLILSLPEFQLN